MKNKVHVKYYFESSLTTYYLGKQTLIIKIIKLAII